MFPKILLNVTFQTWKNAALTSDILSDVNRGFLTHLQNVVERIPLAKIHEKHDKEKKIKYAIKLIGVEHGSFRPHVLEE